MTTHTHEGGGGFARRIQVRVTGTHRQIPPLAKVKETGRRVAPNSPGSILEYFAEATESASEAVSTGAGVTAPKVRTGDDEYYENQ